MEQAFVHGDGLIELTVHEVGIGQGAVDENVGGILFKIFFCCSDASPSLIGTGEGGGNGSDHLAIHGETADEVPTPEDEGRGIVLFLIAEGELAEGLVGEITSRDVL